MTQIQLYSTQTRKSRVRFVLCQILLALVGTFEHQQRNVNLKKGDLAVVCWPRSPMIKSAQDGEGEANHLRSWD